MSVVAVHWFLTLSLILSGIPHDAVSIAIIPHEYENKADCEKAAALWELSVSSAARAAVQPIAICVGQSVYGG